VAVAVVVMMVVQELVVAVALADLELHYQKDLVVLVLLQNLHSLLLQPLTL
jgi:hypothetical protein